MQRKLIISILTLLIVISVVFTISRALSTLTNPVSQSKANSSQKNLDIKNSDKINQDTGEKKLGDEKNVLAESKALLDSLIKEKEVIAEKIDTYDNIISTFNSAVQVFIVMVTLLTIFFAIKAYDHANELKKTKEEILRMKEEAELSIERKIMGEIASRYSEKINSLQSRTSTFQEEIVSLQKRIDHLYSSAHFLGSPQKYFTHATHAYELGDYDTAELFYRMELKNNPDSVNAGVGLARTYLQLHKYQEALEEIDRALEKDLSNPKFNILGQMSVLKAEILMELGRIKDASQILEEIKKVNPGYKKVDRLLDMCKKEKH